MMSDFDVFHQIGMSGLSDVLSEHATIVMTTRQGKIIYVNDPFCALSGYPREELLDQDLRLVNSGFHPNAFFEKMWSTILLGKIWKGEIKNRAKEGHFYWVETTIVPLKNNQGEVERFLSLKTDITRHKLLVEKAKDIEEFSQEVARLTKTGGWSYFPQSGEVFWTPETYRLHEVEVGEKIEVDQAINFYLPEARPVIRAALEEAVREGKGWDLELPLQTKNGNILWAHAVGKVEFRDGKVYRVYGTFQDIFERKSTIEALRTSEEIFKLYMQHTPAAVAMFDRNMRYMAWSDRWTKDYHLDHQNLWGRSHYEVFPEIPDRWKEDHRRVLAGETCINEDDYFVRDDGRVDYLRYELHPWRDGKGEVGGLIMFTEVITDRRLAAIERKNFEQKFQQTQKLESLGVLAGGIAHDFNNLLTGILGNASFIRDQLPPSHELMTSVNAIDEASHRAADLCHQMLAYAGKGRLERASVDLNELIEGTSKLLLHSISKNTVLEFELVKNLPVISADITQLRQIVMNLVINASDSMGDRYGNIRVKTERVILSESDLKKGFVAPNALPGAYVLLSVADNGCGMNQATIDRIFEPFFTTKFTGRGLGLSAVLGIVQGHDGVLKVESQPELGSTFEVYFPQADVKIFPEKESEKLILWKGSGTVLLIEDEPYVREIVCRWIRFQGLHVIEAEDGVQGVELFQKNKEKISVVITDLTMPKLSGGQVLEMIREIDERVPCILMTGYTQVDLQHYLSQYPRLQYLKKPFEAYHFCNLLKVAHDMSKE